MWSSVLPSNQTGSLAAVERGRPFFRPPCLAREAMLCSVGEQGGPGEGAQPSGNIAFFMTPYVQRLSRGPSGPCCRRGSLISLN